MVGVCRPQRKSIFIQTVVKFLCIKKEEFSLQTESELYHIHFLIWTMF